MSRRLLPSFLAWGSLSLLLAACGLSEEGAAVEFPDSGVGGAGGGGGSAASGGTSAGGAGGTSGGAGGTSGGAGGSGGDAGAGGGAAAGGAGGTGGASGSSGTGGASGGTGGTGGTGGASGGTGGATGGTGGASGGTGGASGGTGGATGGTGGASGGTGGATGGTGGASGGTGGATGGSGGTTADPCTGLCTDANATCTTAAVCQCNTGFINTDTDSDPKTAKCTSSIVLGVKVKVAIDHKDCGHLTIKLRGPNATVITLMSRPGNNEGADDGGGIVAGDLTGLDKGYPVTFDDVAAVAAEDMGGSAGPFAYVCKDDNVCSYKPDKGSATGPTSLKAAFQTVDAVGKWTLCVGDSNWLVGGTLEQWELTFTTSGGSFTRASPANLGQGIKDDGYDGTLGSMACRDIDVK